MQSASACYTPVFQAAIPDVLPNEKQYTRALSLSRLAYDLESVASPLIAAALLTVVSFNSLFIGTIVGFIGAALLVFSVTLPRPKEARCPELRSGHVTRETIVPTCIGVTILQRPAGSTGTLTETHYHGNEWA